MWWCNKDLNRVLTRGHSDPENWVRTFGSKFLGPAKWVHRQLGPILFGSQIWHQKPIENIRATKKVRYQNVAPIISYIFGILLFL